MGNLWRAGRRDAAPYGLIKIQVTAYEILRYAQNDRAVAGWGWNPALPCPRSAAAGIRTQSPPAVSDMANRQRAGI